MNGGQNRKEVKIEIQFIVSIDLSDLPDKGVATATAVSHIATAVSIIFSRLYEQNINGVTIPKNLSIDMAVIVNTEEMNATSKMHQFVVPEIFKLKFCSKNNSLDLRRVH